MNEKEYTISFTDNKSPDWKILTLEIVEGDGSVMYEDVSVNRVNKKGETFPNFDNLKVGERVKGNLWVSSAGKRYLFAPDTNKLAGGDYTKPQGGFKVGMQKMAEEKREFIKDTQETKNSAIREAGAQRDAVLMVTTFYPEFTDATVATEKERILKEKYLYWREFFLNQPPF